MTTSPIGVVDVDRREVARFCDDDRQELELLVEIDVARSDPGSRAGR